MKTLMDIIFWLFSIIGIVLFLTAITVFCITQFQKQKVYYFNCSSIQQECECFNMENYKKVIIHWKD